MRCAFVPVLSAGFLVAASNFAVGDSISGIEAIGQPPGVLTSAATAISGDGATILVVGSTSNQNVSFTWRRDTGFQLLSAPSGENVFARNISDDGRTVVSNQYIWTDGVRQPVPHGSSLALLRAVSPTGQFVGGWRWPVPPATVGNMFRWSPDAGRVDLSPIPGVGMSSGVPYDISLDGQTMVGGQAISGSVKPFRWTTEGGVEFFNSAAFVGYCDFRMLSADETVAGGIGNGSVLRHTFATSTTAAQTSYLPILAGSATMDFGGMTADANLIVGTAFSGGLQAGFVWTPDRGTVSASSYLASYGFDVASWRLDSVAGVSSDGRVLVGSGQQHGIPTLWMATIPSPSGTYILFAGYLWTVRRRR